MTNKVKAALITLGIYTILPVIFTLIFKFPRQAIYTIVFIIILVILCISYYVILNMLEDRPLKGYQGDKLQKKIQPWDI